jgi:hypothetical protein
MDEQMQKCYDEARAKYGIISRGLTSESWFKLGWEAGIKYGMGAFAGEPLRDLDDCV